MRAPLKTIFTTASALVLLAACEKKEGNTFQVEGTVKNATASTVYLEEATISNMQPVIVDSAKVEKDGSFTLNTTAKEESIFLLRFNNQPNPFASLINDSKKITVKADALNPTDIYTVQGSPASQTLRDYLTESNKKLTGIYTLSLQLDSLGQTAAPDSIIRPVADSRNRAAEEYKSYATSLITNSKSAPLSVFVLGSYQSYASSPALGLQPLSPDQVTGLITQTAKKFPEHTGLATLKASLETPPAGAPASQQSGLNKPAPDFTLPDVNGKPVALSSFKGKYVLVDFWASWCAPCRQENPNVVKAYQQFKDKNFTVLGVSLDKAKEPWVKAIQADNLAWTHVSDLKFWDSMVVPMYGIEGIPYNVLLDPNGVVIAEGLRGEQLIQKLSEVLK